MAGFTNAKEKSILDAEFPTTGATTHVAYSTNGSSEWAGLDRTPVGATGWKAASGSAPAVKKNASTITSDGATSAGTVTHTALFSASTGGTQITDWEALASSKTLALGDKLEFAEDALTVSLD